MKMAFTSGILKSALVVATLAACSAEAPKRATGVEVEKRNKVELVRMPYLLMAEKNGAGELSEATRSGIDRFMSEIEARYGDVLVIDRGENVSEGRVKAVASYFSGLGLEVGDTDGVFGPAPAAGNLMLYIERYVVELPNCPDYSNPGTPDYQNAGLPNLGCSNVTALGLMVANPRDLVDGQTDKKRTSEPAIRAVTRARTGNATTGN